MSSNIRITRICQFCNKEFIAKTTVTKCCSDTCIKRLYKARKRESKIEQSNQETQKTILRPIEELKEKEFLSVLDASKLLGVSERTLYRLMQNGTLNFGKVGKRTIIKRADLDRFFG